MNVGQLCSRQIVSIGLGASLSEAVALMHSEGVGAVVVTRPGADRPQLAGIITDRDIVHAQLQRIADFSQLSIADTMTRDPLTINEAEDIGVALRRMRARGVRRAPVIDASGALVGLISSDDLLAQIAIDVGGLADIVAVVHQHARAGGGPGS